MRLILPYIPSSMLDKVPTVAAEARERKGYLIGIKVGTPFNLKDTNYHLTIDFGEKGMPYQLIAATSPLGQPEKAYMRQLRKQK